METANHECYVSLEVANLLKEAGFDWKVNHYYLTKNGKTEIKSDFRYPAQNYNEPMATMDSKSFEFEVCSCPTLEVAQRWLREVKGYYVFVTDDSQCVEPNLIWVITRPSYLAGMCKGSTYEDYLEAGINKCLTLLLKEK